MDADLERKNNDHLRPFWKILDFVTERNSHLLTEDETRIVESFLGLSEYGKFLFVRLFDRNYTENKEVRARKIEGYVGQELFGKVLQELMSKKLVVKVEADDLPKVLHALTVEELRSITGMMKISTSSKRKQEVIKELLTHVKNSTTQTTFGAKSLAKYLTNHIQSCHGGAHLLAEEALETFLKIYRIYYYDSGYDDQSASFSKLYLHGIGQRRYFAYKLDSEPLFKSIEDFDAYQIAVNESVYWTEENKPARLASDQSIISRLDMVLENVCTVVNEMSKDRGRFTADYVWLKTAVKIGTQAPSALGKGDKAMVLFRQWKLLEEFLKQDWYCQHKLMPVLSAKIHIEVELYKQSNLWDWLERALEDIHLARSKVNHNELIDPLMLDVDKKVKTFQSQYNKPFNEWKKRYSVKGNKRNQKKQPHTSNSAPPAPDKVSFKPLVPVLAKLEEYVVVGAEKLEPEPEHEQDKESEMQMECSKTKKQSQIRDFFRMDGTLIPRPKKVETVVIYSDSEDDDMGDDGALEVLEIRDSSHDKQDVKQQSSPQAPKGPTVWASEEDGSTIRVETVALEHYAKIGWRGWHNEGSSLRSIYVLLFWDIIFMEGIEGVFYNHVQTAPLDFYTNEFYERRKDAIDKRLDEIYDNEQFIRNKITDIYTAVSFKKWDRSNSEFKTTGPWVAGTNFDRLSLQDILAVAVYLKPRAVHGICKILAKDYYKYDSGLPDLCIVNDELAACKMVEVKSKNDSLSDTQKVWIHHMIQLGVDVEICRVLTESQYQEHQLQDTKKRKRNSS